MKIAVASGKGGTGKTLIATSLALSLKDKYKVQLLDCDVEEPNDHIFLKPVISGSETVGVPIPEVDEGKCTHCARCAEVCEYHAIAAFPQSVLVFQHLCHGCGACSYFCPAGAITEKQNEIGVVEQGSADGIDIVQGRLNIGEAMPVPIIRKVKEKINGDCVSIIDASPGTSCPVVEAVKDTDFCVLVTEPTPFGLNDLALAVETVKTMNIPCGIVINRGGTEDKKLEDFCSKEKIPVLLTIPLDTEIARLYSKGITLAEGMPQWKKEFTALYSRIQEIINE